MRLLLKYTTLEEKPTPEMTTTTSTTSTMPTSSRKQKMSWWRFAGSWVRCFFALLFAPRDKPNPLKNVPRMTENTPRHVVYRTMETTVSEIKTLKKKNYSVNDVLISCLSGIFAKFGTNDFTNEISTPVHVRSCE